MRLSTKRDSLDGIFPRFSSRRGHPSGGGEAARGEVGLHAVAAALGDENSLSGSSGKSPDTRDGRDPRPASRPVAPPAAPDERVAVLVPVRRRLLDRPADLLPGLEPPPLQRQRLQHLPPRLDQVQVRRVLRLEDELPPRVGQAEQQHVGRPVGVQVVEDRVDPPDVRRDPRLDLAPGSRPSWRRCGSAWTSPRPGWLLAACGPISSRQMTTGPSGGFEASLTP